MMLYAHAVSRKAIGAMGIVLCVIGAFTPVASWAAEATPDDIRAAITEGERAGVCTSKQENASSDCQKITTTCSGSAWQKYIASNYQNQGGSISIKGASGASSGRALMDSEVTSALSQQAVAIRTRHLSLFPACRLDNRGCPADISVCGLGAEYPFTVGNTSYIARVTKHTNRGCGPSGNPGVRLFLGSSGAEAKSEASGEALGYLQANWAENSTRPPGPVQRGTCYCSCIELSGEPACNGKPVGYPVQVGEGLTRDQCAATCGRMPVAATRCQIAPITTTELSPTETRSTQNTAMCFSPSDCAAQGGVYEAGTGGCGTFQGRCYAGEQTIKLGTPIGDTQTVQGLNHYIAVVFRYLISIAGVAATVMFTWGAFQYLIGAAIPNIKSGRAIMTDAVVGLILVLASVMILRVVNPATTDLNPIKIYMINTAQFVHTAFCKDLSVNERLAEAGKRPDLIPFERVSATPDAFTVQPKDAACGTSYWVRNSVASACEGTRCPNRGEACVSCAGGASSGASVGGSSAGGEGGAGGTSGEGGGTGSSGVGDVSEPCRGRAATESVCQKTVFAGTIQYADQRHPEEAYLLLMCNGAQPGSPEQASPEFVEERWVKMEVDLRKASISAGGQTTDEDLTGQAVYRFNVEQSTIEAAKKRCADYGGFRGALIAVQYNDDSVKPAIRALGSVALATSGVVLLVSPGGQLFGGAALVAANAVVQSTPFDDFAILAKQNCTGSTAPFDGYAVGTSDSDEDDVARGMLCGFARGKFLDGTGSYWTEQELTAAVNGEVPITCNFTLSQNTAPSDLELCKEKK